MQCVTFKICEDIYGIDIRLIKEVNPNADICAVPRSTCNVRGIVNIRGQVVLVLDTAVILGREKQNIIDTTHIIILKTRGEIYNSKDVDERWNVDRFCDKPVGLIVDKIGDVVTIGNNEIEQPPHHIDRERINFYKGIFKLDDKPLMILNVEEMM